MKVSQLFIYPIKSMGGFSVEQVDVGVEGPELDRQWMLVDDSGTFLTQRQVPELALLKVRALDSLDSLQSLTAIAGNGAEVVIPKEPQGDSRTVQVWDDEVEAQEVHPDISKWFSQTLNRNVFLVKCSSPRSSDAKYGEPVNYRFADGFPFLMLSQASLDELNQKLHQNGHEPLGFDRFRPNIVIDGGGPGCEDRLRKFHLGEIEFSAVKPCARCVITCTDQHTAQVSKEPLKTLSGYRRDGRSIYFGQNLIHLGVGILKVGDTLS